MVHLFERTIYGFFFKIDGVFGCTTQGSCHCSPCHVVNCRLKDCFGVVVYFYSRVFNPEDDSSLTAIELEQYRNPLPLSI